MPPRTPRRPRKRPKPRAKTGLSLPSSAPAGSLLDRGAARRLISPAEVERLKMVILTSVDPAAKIEALRKLALSPLPDADRGVLCLRALTDADASVRREAAVLLGSFGMAPDFVEALRVLAGGEPKERVLSLEKLASQAAARTPAERSVALAVLHGCLDSEKDPGARAALLRAVASHAETARGRPDLVESLLRAAVRAAVVDLARSGDAARAVFEALSRVEPETASRTLWREAVAIQDRPLRAFAYAGALASPPPPDLVPEIAARLADEVRRGNLDELEFRKSIEVFHVAGDPALLTLLDLRSDLPDQGGMSWVGLVDSFAVSGRMGPAARRRAVEDLLTLLADGSKGVRLTVLECRILQHPDLPADLRSRVAAEVVRHVHVFGPGRGFDLARSVLRRLGADALDPLGAALRESPYPPEREAAVELIADIASRADLTDARRAAVIDLLRAGETTGRVAPGALVRAVGRVAAGVRDDAPLVGRIHADFEALRRGASHAPDLLVALCWVSSSPAADPRAAAETALQTLDYVMGPLPDTPLGEEDSPDGKRLVIGVGTRVYTEIVPALLEGLVVLYRSGRLTPRAREQVRSRLLAKWDLVASYREVWAPGNLIGLAETLAAIALADADDAEVRLEVIDRLRASIRNISIVRVLSTLCGGSIDAGDGSARRMGELAATLFQMLGMGEYAEAGDRLTILGALGRIAASPRIGTDERSSSDARRRIVEKLLEEESLDWREYSATMRVLLESPAVPEEWKERVKRRLARRTR